ncbi:NAD-binding protein [Hysterangium stoloniferum]|nr:NAD-binding protein [Hysterangium stoloniferum]
MSLPTSAHLSRSQYVIAIAGATGKLGSVISRVVLTEPYRPFFSRVVLLVRNPASPVAQELKELGGELAKVDVKDSAAMGGVLRDVDIVVNALGPGDQDASDSLLEAVLANRILLYIPSEFGVDHRYNDFEHVVWTKKQKHIERARKSGEGRMKVVPIYVGLILELGFEHEYGFDSNGKQYTAVGSPDVKITFTSFVDIARTVAQVAIQAVSSPSTFPDNIRVAGSTVSMKEIRDIMSHESGEEIQLASLGGPETYKRDLQEEFGSKGGFRSYIRLLMGEGKVDFSKNNDDELVNPKEKQWEWTKVEEQARVTKGKPDCI